MLKHYAAVRLVVDNNSSSESSIPSPRAKRKRAKCHLPGMLPFADHIETAGWPTSSNLRANAEGPPKRSTISDTKARASSMGTQRIKSFDTTQSQILDAARKPRISENLIVVESPESVGTEAAISRKVAERVLDIFKQTGLSKTDFAAKMGLDYKQFWYRANDGQFEITALIRLADNLRLSLDYVCARIPDPEPPAGMSPPQDFWSLRARQAPTPSTKTPERAKR